MVSFICVCGVVSFICVCCVVSFICDDDVGCGVSVMGVSGMGVCVYVSFIVVIGVSESVGSVVWVSAGDLNK